MIGDGLVYWRAFDQSARAYHRTRAGVGHVTLKRGNDDDPIQHWQTEGYPTELRSKLQRWQEHGMSTMPLVGAKAIVVYPGGQRGQGIIVGVDDGRYRPTKLKGGESQFYIVDEAKADGTEGKMRPVLQGLLKWVTKFFGREINIGTAEDTTVIKFADKHGNTMVFGESGVTINGALINLSGDVITKAGHDLDTHVHTGVMSGGSDTGPPA